MKKILSLVLAIGMLLSLCCVYAEGIEKNDYSSTITGKIEDGCYIITVRTNPNDQGEWTADEMSQADSSVMLDRVDHEEGAFIARYKPVKDGKATIKIRHYSEHRVCIEMHSFDLLVKDGAVQESVGGSYTASPVEDDLDKYFSGEWLEKDTEFTILDVTKEIAGGWHVELTSPISHGAWIIRATAFYDCDYDAFIYADGIKYNLSPDEKTPEIQVATDLWGMLKFSSTEENLQLIWNETENSGINETVFDRAPALPAYVYTGENEIEGAVANGLATLGYSSQFLSESGCVMIPTVTIHKTEMIDDTHAKAYGTFWVLNYAKRGSVLICISGGELSGIASLEKIDQKWQMTGLEEAGDGDEYTADLERFANGDLELLQKYLESSDLLTPEQEEIRIRLIRDYVATNELPITSFQDYGWDPVWLN